ncbi:MAG: hypothetical protein LBH00_12945 [Planctomycetaceae bacterium]|jgi:hypothetical protein|nr:hypothetical protein [Planctomycetaceae bacterium]
MFNRLLFIAVLAGLLSTATGCIHAIFSGDPMKRSNQLLMKSEDMRLIHDEWERFWMLDQPSHMTPYRTHGGIM